MISRVKAPSDAVELEVHLGDLARVAQGEQVKPFDFVLPSSDTSEEPIPENLGAAGNKDLESINTLNSLGTQNTVDVLLFADKGRVSKL